jgi:hypothetical protein
LPLLLGWATVLAVLLEIAMSDPDSKLKLVSEKSRAELEGEWAKRKLDHALVELAANLMRVVRGAGRPEAIVDNCACVVTAALSYQDVTKRYPSPNDIASSLRLEHEPITDYESFWGGKQFAIRDMISGSLQVAASTLIGQRLQIDQGEKEMDRAFREMERLLEDLRQKRDEEAKAAVIKPKPASRKKPKPKSW